MPKPFIAARIPEDLDAAINQMCETEGVKRTDVLINALRFYLGKIGGGNDKTPIEQISALWEEVSQIGKRLDLAGIPDPEKNSTVLEEKIDNTQITNKNKISSKMAEEIDVKKTDNNNDNVQSAFKLQLETLGESMERQVWSTKQIEEAGINRNTLKTWHRNRRLPQSRNGITIHRYIRKEKTKSGQIIIWEISDNR